MTGPRYKKGSSTTRARGNKSPVRRVKGTSARQRKRQRKLSAPLRKIIKGMGG